MSDGRGASAAPAAKLVRDVLPAAGDPVFLGAIVGAALDLRAVELEPAIRAAYQAGRVEEEIAGRWKDVAHELRRGRG